MGDIKHYEDVYAGYTVIPTRLYRLQPIGIGTPLVESLSSYVQRLADAHAVSASHLVKYEINPLLALGRLRPDNVSVGARSKISAIDGLGRTAREWVDAIESLTYVSGLQNLTLLPFERIFWEGKVFHKPKSWCPKCIEEWTRDGKPIYWPLIWSLHPVKICPMHLIPLESNCSNCSSTSSPLRPISTPGYCPICGRWFGYSAYHRDMPREIHYSVWAAKTVSKLLAAGPVIANHVGLSGAIPELIEYVIRTGIKRGGIRSLARVVRISTSKLTGWLEGQQLPKLHELLYVCCVFKLDLLDTISRKRNTSDDRVLVDHVLMPQLDKDSKVSGTIDWVSLSALLRDVASGKASLMRVPDIARVYKCSLMSVYKRYPELCREISAKNALHLKKVRAIEKAEGSTEQ